MTKISPTEHASQVPRSLQRGLAALELLSTHPEGLSFTAVQKHLGVPKMTVTRLLTALCELGYLVKQTDGLYFRGPRFIALIASEPLESRLRRVCLSPLRHLVDECRNSGLIIHWNGELLQVLERVLHEESLVLVAPGHVIQQPHRYPAGVFSFSKEHWEGIFARTPEKLSEEDVSRSWYEGELCRYETHGYAFGNQEGRNRLAAPIFRGDILVGALAIGGTPVSLPESRMDEVGRCAVETARHCSEHL